MSHSDMIQRKLDRFHALVEQELQKALSNAAGYEITIDNATEFMKNHVLVNNYNAYQSDFLLDGVVIFSVKFPEFMVQS